MTLERAILDLDKQIEELTAKLDPKRPGADLETFAVVRALSLARTFLRALPADISDWREIEESYATARPKVGKELKEERAAANARA